MNEMIYETVVTTVSPQGLPHVAPMGIRYLDDRVVLLPFRPSTTLDNILASGHAVLNVLTDVRVFAGCVCGNKQWPVHALDPFPGVRLQAALSHIELALATQDHTDPQRPRLGLQRLREVQHAPFLGLNRAQAAVLEGAVLVSRLHLLSHDKIEREMAYLQIAIDKTAGPAEHEAWGWLQDAVARQTRPASGAA
jgi:hypothetical protein